MARGKWERSRGIARVAEETGSLDGDEDAWEPQQEMHALAVFTAHIEYDVGGTWEFEDGPERVALDEALTWSRERAAKVAVQWYSPDGEIVSSAGEIPLEGAPAWEGHMLVPRRIPGWEHLDRTDDDEPISWEVIARGSVLPVDDTFAGRLADGLRAVPGIDVIAVKADPASLPEGGTGYFVVTDDVAVHTRLVARTYNEACRRAADVCADIAGRCAPASDQHWDAEQTEAYPTDSRVAKNADVEQRGYFD